MTGKMNSRESKSRLIDDNIRNNNDSEHIQSTNGALKSLLNDHILENRKSLKESQINLSKIASYCDANYFQVDSQDEAFNVTKNYAQQALASLASQIYSFASNIQMAINLLENQFDLIETQTRYIEKRIKLNEEKSGRREIGLLTKPKRFYLQPPVIYPDRPKMKMSHKYIQDSIDFSSLDHIGIAHKIYEENDKLKTFDICTIPPIKSATLRPSKSSNLSSIILPQTNDPISNTSMYGRTQGSVRPPTPPTVAPVMFGSLARNYKDYRTLHHPTPLVVPPPQVPFNYASSKDINSATKQQGNNNQLSKSSPCQIVGSVQKTPAMIEQETKSNQQQNDTEISKKSNENVCKSPRDSQSDDQDWIPLNYIQKVVAIYDYIADKDDELSFQENSIIYVIRKNEDGWWEGVLNGITGLFPGNYVEPCM